MIVSVGALQEPVVQLPPGSTACFVSVVGMWISSCHWQSKRPWAPAHAFWNDLTSRGGLSSGTPHGGPSVTCAGSAGSRVKGFVHAPRLRSTQMASQAASSDGGASSPVFETGERRLHLYRSLPSLSQGSSFTGTDSQETLVQPPHVDARQNRRNRRNRQNRLRLAGQRWMPQYGGRHIVLRITVARNTVEGGERRRKLSVRWSSNNHPLVWPWQAATCAGSFVEDAEGFFDIEFVRVDVHLPSGWVQ